MKPRGKLVALSTMAVGTVVLAVAGVAESDFFREKWYTAKLGSGDLQDRLSAIHELRNMRSRGAVPRILEVLEKEKCFDVSMAGIEAIREIQTDGDVILLSRALEDGGLEFVAPFVLTLESQKLPNALATIISGEKKATIRTAAIFMMRGLGLGQDPAERLVLEQALMDGDPAVREAAGEALNTISRKRDEVRR